jgi:hypothetical protein
LTEIDFAVVPTVFRIFAFDASTTDRDPNRLLTVTVDPLMDVTVPKTNPPLPARVNPADGPDAPLGARKPPPPPVGAHAPVPAMTSSVTLTAGPLEAPVALMQSPALTLVRDPGACFVIAVFDVMVTFELPLLVAVVLIVNDLREIDVTAPVTTPVTDAASATGTTTTAAPAHTASSLLIRQPPSRNIACNERYRTDLRSSRRPAEELLKPVHNEFADAAH